MASLQKWAVYLCLFAVGIYFLKQYMNGPMCASDAKINGKVAIVTGANTGIGKATSRDLFLRGGKIYMACRSLARCENARKDILEDVGGDSSQLIVMKLDLSSLASVRGFAQEFKEKEGKLDILMNNAGVMWVPYSLTVDGFESTFAVNHLGHFLLTNLLMDQVVAAAPGRVVTVSSLGHTFYPMDFDNMNGEKNYQRVEAYSKSKLANVLFSRELAKKLQGTGVTTYSLHPGAINTELGRYTPVLSHPVVYTIFQYLGWPLLKDAIYGAQTQICCAVDPALADQSGLYYSDCAETAPSEDAQSDETASRLWKVSAEMVKLLPQETSTSLK